MREIVAKFFEKYKLTPSGIINAHEHNWKKYDDVIWLVSSFRLDCLLWYFCSLHSYKTTTGKYSFKGAEVYSFRTVHGMERRTNDLYLREDRVTHLSAA